MKAVDEMRQMLGGLDPARGGPPVDEGRRARELTSILATDRRAISVRRPAPRRRVLLVAGAAVAVVAAGGVLVEMGRESQPAYAATPVVLAYGPSATAEPAGTRLRHLADVAALQAAPSRPASTVEYLESANWFLNSATSGQRVTSAVVPEQWRSWRTDDDGGRRVVKSLPPTFRSDADRRTWEQQGERINQSETRRDFAAGELRPGWRGEVPADVDALRSWLTAGGSAREEPVQYLEDVAELAGVRLLNPAQRAAVLRLLADLPGITASGTVTDRAGRNGEAFSITSSFHGLPAQYTIIIDPLSGALLGYEEVLTTTAGKLNVTIPAVTSYRTYLVAEYAAMPR
ncbi:CU044_5270 family protein [Polymorphospora sp. A560]